MYRMHVEKSQQIIVKRKTQHTNALLFAWWSEMRMRGPEGGHGLGADRGPSDGGRIGRKGLA